MATRYPLVHASLICAAVLLHTGPAAAETYDSQHYELRVVTVADNLTHPWGLTFLPDGRMLVTERPGRIRVVSKNGKRGPPVRGVPEVYAVGQGCMLDITLDPSYEQTRLIYFSYAEPGEGGGGTAVARARLDLEANRLRGLEVIFRQVPKTTGGRHFGSRLAFNRYGHLFVTVGERGERERVQNFAINRGNVVRIEPDGDIPEDNPFVGRDGYRPEVWSYGHRNPQGAALHFETGELWIHEHGAQGGDEINVPRPVGTTAGRSSPMASTTAAAGLASALTPDFDSCRDMTGAPARARSSVIKDLSALRRSRGRRVCRH